VAIIRLRRPTWRFPERALLSDGLGSVRRVLRGAAHRDSVGAGLGAEGGEMIPSKRSIRTMAAVLAGFVIFGSVADAVAWGSKGHRIIGHVARELLSPDARAEIVALMASDDLATFALYLDQNK